MRKSKIVLGVALTGFVIGALGTTNVAHRILGESAYLLSGIGFTAFVSGVVVGCMLGFNSKCPACQKPGSSAKCFCPGCGETLYVAWQGQWKRAQRIIWGAGIGLMATVFIFGALKGNEGVFAAVIFFYVIVIIALSLSTSVKKSTSCPKCGAGFLGKGGVHTDPNFCTSCGIALK